jgi:hypothetical protein
VGTCKLTNQHAASFACCLLHIGFPLGLLFEPKDGGDIFLRNVGWLLTDYTALYSRRHKPFEMDPLLRAENLKHINLCYCGVRTGLCQTSSDYSNTGRVSCLICAVGEQLTVADAIPSRLVVLIRPLWRQAAPGTLPDSGAASLQEQPDLKTQAYKYSPFICLSWAAGFCWLVLPQDTIPLVYSV